MKTLYDQLKPHVKAALDENHEDYGTTIDYIFDKLQTVNRYSELTINDVKTLNTFSDQHLHTTTQINLMYGDHLFNN